MAIPPGPISLMVLNMTLEKYLRQTYILAVGVALIEASYCLIAVLAATAVQSIIEGFIENNPGFVLAFQFIVIAGLIIIGVYIIVTAKNNNKNLTNGQIPKNKFAKKLTEKGPFFIGVALALSNLANPPFMTSLAIMATQVKKLGLLQFYPLDHLLFALSFGLGQFLWLFGLAKITSKFRHNISPNFTAKLKIVAGVVFIVAALLIAFKYLITIN